MKSSKLRRALKLYKVIEKIQEKSRRKEDSDKRKLEKSNEKIKVKKYQEKKNTCKNTSAINEK